VDEGVKKYGVLREESVRYYNVGLEKVEQAKGFKDAKVEQAKDFKEARVTQIKGFTDPKVEKIAEFKEAKVAQIHGFTDPKVEKIKEFKEARTAQIREFTDPKLEKIMEFKETRVNQIKEFADPRVEKIKSTMEPKVAVITARKEKMQELLRVPASLDLQGLNCETLLGKVASGLEKVEAIINKYMPLEEQEEDSESDSVSSASNSSCTRINRSAVSITTRIFLVFMIKIKMLFSFPPQLKTLYKDGTLKLKMRTFTTDMKDTLVSKVEKGKITEKLAPVVKKVTQTSLFKKVVQLGVLGSEKVLGKEKTTTLLSKAETFIPAAWKAAPPPEKQMKHQKKTR